MNLPHHRRYNWKLLWKWYWLPVSIICTALLVTAMLTALAYLSEALAATHAELTDQREVVAQFDKVLTGKAKMFGDDFKVERVDLKPLAHGITYREK